MRSTDCTPRGRPRLGLQWGLLLRRRAALHPGLPYDVPGPDIDNASVSRLRHGRGEQGAVPLPHRRGPNGAFDPVQNAFAHGPRL